MRSFILAAALLCGAPHPALSQPTSPGETTAESPARAAANQFLQAMAASASTEEFVGSNFTSSALAGEAAAVRAKALDRLKQHSGGFDAIEWKPQGDRMIELVAAARRGGKFARIVLFTSGKEPGKISSIFVLPARDPRRAAADAFPRAGVSEAEIARLVKRRLDSLAEEGGFSGSVLIAHRDKVILREARGLADETWRIPNRTDTRFQIASVGKMWTAAVVLQLSDQGKLSLDDHLAKWVPEFPHGEAAQKITLRQLLQHKGGLAEWDNRSKEILTSAEMATTMKSPPTGEPGAGFSYSNAGYILLAAAAERATGKRFETLIQDLVFDKAGMKASGMWPVAEVIPNRATGYLRPASDPLGFGPKFANDQYLGAAGDGSGGGYSTVDDMFAFHRALAKGMSKSASVAGMAAQPVDFPGAPRPSKYGYGLRLTDCAGVAVLGHGGGGPNSGVSAATYGSMDGEWTVVVLGNMDPPAPEELALDICELVHSK